MESLNNLLLQEDLEMIAKERLPFDRMKNANILVTGATGLVGSVMVKALACCNRIHNLNMTVYAFVRNADKAKITYGNLVNRKDIKLIIGDIINPIEINDSIDYIIHGASVTTSKVFISNPVETIRTSLVGTDNLLKLAKDKNVKSMVYISSMEAFGITNPNLKDVREEDLGYIDVMNVRSCYSEGKRMCEVMCASYAHEYNVPVKIARLAQTFGAGVPKADTRVFAQFAKSVIQKEDIVLHTKGESTGNYCYTADAISGLLTILLKGDTGEVYTVANPNTTIKIKDMAKLIAEQLANNEIRVIFDIPESSFTYGYAPDVCMHLNADKLKALGWSAKYDLLEMYERLIKSFEEENENN